MGPACERARPHSYPAGRAALERRAFRIINMPAHSEQAPPPRLGVAKQTAKWKLCSLPSAPPLPLPQMLLLLLSMFSSPLMFRAAGCLPPASNQNLIAGAVRGAALAILTGRETDDIARWRLASAPPAAASWRRRGPSSSAKTGCVYTYAYLPSRHVAAAMSLTSRFRARPSRQRRARATQPPSRA
jgi:hypothetical protein